MPVDCDISSLHFLVTIPQTMISVDSLHRLSSSFSQLPASSATTLWPQSSALVTSLPSVVAPDAQAALHHQHCPYLPIHSIPLDRSPICDAGAVVEHISPATFWSKPSRYQGKNTSLVQCSERAHVQDEVLLNLDEMRLNPPCVTNTTHSHISFMLFGY
jgi:hypothetical protein